MVNEVSRRKATAKAKLKANCQEERVQLWKQNFVNLLGQPPKVTHEPITKIISNQLDIKLGQFTQEELDSELTKVIDTLTQEDFHGAFQKVLERYNKCIAAGGDYFEGD